MEPTPDQLAQLALMLLARKAATTLDAEHEEPAALRKALLVMAALTQEPRNPAARHFADYVLTSFQPLVAHMKDFDLELWDDQAMGVRRGPKGDIIVAVPRKLVDALMEEFAAEDSETQREVLEGVMADAEESMAPWSTTDERYVGFYDVMGFTARVGAAGGDHSGLHAVMLRLHNAVQIAEKMVAQGDFFSQNVSSCKIPSGQVRAVQFSDAIVAITRDASPACSLLIQLASQVFFLHGLKNGVAIRGAISRGLVTADFEHSIFFGQPIIDAYRLGESQCWYGVALHPTAEESQETNVGLLGEDEIPVVESFAVPTKTEEEPEELSVINWPVFAESRDDLVELLQPFDGRDSPEAGKLLKYHERTLSFAEKMWSKYRG